MVGGAITFYGVAAAQSSMLAGTFAPPAPPLPRASAWLGKMGARGSARGASWVTQMDRGFRASGRRGTSRKPDGNATGVTRRANGDLARTRRTA